MTIYGMKIAYKSISPYATYRTYSSLHSIFFVDWHLLSFQK
jgi:hypothetical protein